MEPFTGPQTPFWQLANQLASLGLKALAGACLLPQMQAQAFQIMAQEAWWGLCVVEPLEGLQSQWILHRNLMP